MFFPAADTKPTAFDGATVRVSSTDRHYGPTWKEQSLTVSAPQTLSVELVELPPQNTIIIILLKEARAV